MTPAFCAMSPAELAAIEICGAKVVAAICDVATGVASALATVALGATVVATATPAASLPVDGRLTALAGINEPAEEVNWLDAAVGVGAVAAPISHCICEKNWIA